MQTKLVRCGDSHDCVECGKKIAKGELASKNYRKAETYRERLHDDASGNVAWYRHTYCVENTSN